MIEEGFQKARELCERHFSKKAAIIPFPKLCADAKRRWDQIPESDRKEIMDSVWCSHSTGVTYMQLCEGIMSERSLVLHGTCKKCGGEAARVIEPTEG